MGGNKTIQGHTCVGIRQAVVATTVDNVAKHMHLLVAHRCCCYICYIHPTTDAEPYKVINI